MIVLDIASWALILLGAAFCVIGAIGLLRIPGGRVLLLLFIFGLTLPFEGIIIPLYFLARDLGIINTRLAIVLPLIGLFMPFAVFWMRAHFVNLPSEITEAARVDGASTWELFRFVHVPLARAPIASLGILLAVWAWNQFLLALVLVEDPTERTMAGALGSFQGHYATDIPLLCAGTILILLPTILAVRLGVPFYFGGTALLIAVGVGLDTIAQVEAHLVSRQYEGFARGTRIRGRLAR